MKKVFLISPAEPGKRIQLGMERLTGQLMASGYQTEHLALPEDYASYRNLDGDVIYVGTKDDDPFIAWLREEDLLLFHTVKGEKEGFYIQTCPGKLTVICGWDETGALYGCMELCGRIKADGILPDEISFADAPVYKLRGPAVGLQKTTIEPPRHTYEYPITPSRFPWFYDRKLWEKFLDQLLEMRCNVLYIWSGHPFSSLVKVADYPEALEVTEEEFELNRETFLWLTEECDRRGIWLVLKFYNIHIPYPFAVAHNLDLLQSSINPLVADYTRKSIREFIKSFPHIGLMVCLGEALRGTQNKTDWFVDTIVPAVKEGMEEAGMTEEPPIILRGHDCDAYGAMQLAKKQYSNLYTMWKYNGEGLTTYLPRGNWQKTHEQLAGAGTTHIINVHIVADLEPFRFMAPLYIQKCVQAGQYRLGANGLHLYPLFYWDWPYSPDKTEPRLLQMDRDRIWFTSWFRYAWNPDRDEETEILYWSREFAAQYGLTVSQGRKLLEAMEAAGRCAPTILGRVGITEGNRQTLSLGMTMSEFTNVKNYRPNLELWHSVARKGEQPQEYVDRELAGQPHIGETPYDMAELVDGLAEKAVQAYRAMIEENPDAPVSDEIAAIGTDIDAIYHMSVSYSKKVLAAMEILFYKAGMDENCFGDTALLDRAAAYLKESLDEYRELTELTKKTYLFANSMQTPQRKIPFPNGKTYGHWENCLPEYEKEYECLLKHTAELKAGKSPNQTDGIAVQPLTSAPFTVVSEGAEAYTMKLGESVSMGTQRPLQQLAPELEGLTGVRFDFGKAMEGKMPVTLKLEEDSYILIGYMKAKSIEWLQVPDLETNTHADDRGGLAILYRGAVKAEGCPVADIHAFRYEAGEHTLYFGTGAYMIAGVISAKERPQPREVDYDGKVANTLDWLYEP